RIGEAESKIHNIPIESVHFHEVGAIDSIMDIVGACVAFDALKIERIISSPLHVGSGVFQCAHGTYPVPGPATAELLKGVPIYSKDVEAEWATPPGPPTIPTRPESYGPIPILRSKKTANAPGPRNTPKSPTPLP